MPRPDRWRHALILTVTRRCNLRCAYCPTLKDGEPDLSIDDARRAIHIFMERFGGGDLKLFGGEPMLMPEVVEAVIREAPPEIRVYLSTNGMFLTPQWFALLRAHPSVTLTISLDGAPRDHNGLRRGADSHTAVLQWREELQTLPRMVVTQTIAPSTAGRAAENFRYLRGLGFTRFNLLPGYYLPWTAAQLDALDQSFRAIEAEITAAWRSGERLYLRNLFVSAPTPFYNSGMVVDCDRTIHASNLILSGAFDKLRAQTALGTLDDPPSVAALDAGAQAAAQLLHAQLSPEVRDSTAAVDRLLTGLCNRLYPAYFQRRQETGMRQAERQR